MTHNHDNNCPVCRYVMNRHKNKLKILDNQNIERSRCNAYCLSASYLKLTPKAGLISA